ncbi:hypothetical protein PENANT_c008G00673 [Penicillium antarcticum]|uniref:F-box domain-containing protein n=1 Tax=Penicillium antarcticum TaxID=416450 RepID=A0A1V6QAV2_9EURO|nr:uncharacterized protein N7508_007019 [Penicillium antarcticum]KAJ5302156.1 hypothetical protein N7508_007019 [Penicillium antarcticum]OQD86335.1 hypothetical protein PENANT_c008G00673 [Penicillium antarcticum]
MSDQFFRATEKVKIIIKMRPWSPKRSKKQEDGSGRCYLMELPTELLLEIVSHLTVLPEAALALTCKRMFAISGEILFSKSLRFSRDFAPLFHHYRNGHNFVTPRWSFLTLLENSRWKLCSMCLKLHPRAAFSPRELRRNPDLRICNVGELAGIVDLCPCKKLTFRDKLDLVDHVRVRQITLQALKSEFGNAVDERYCWHTCTEQYGPTELKTSLFPELDHKNELVLRTEYQLTTEPGQVGKEDFMTPRFGCAHRSVDLWLSSVYQTTICRLFDSFCSSCKRISVCSACNTTLKCPRKQPFNTEKSNRATYSFWTERNLGGTSSIPDAIWGNQRIHPAEPSISVENCNELCPWTVREHPALSFTPSLGEEIIDPAMGNSPINQLYSSLRNL